MSANDFTHDELVELTNLFNAATHVTTLRVRRGDARIELLKTGGNAKVAAYIEPAAQHATPTPIVVRSKTVGTFIRASAPEERPFVEPGAHVKSDTIISRINVIRRPIDVLAETSGQLIAILVADGQPVEFGQPLATMIPDA